MVCFGHFVTSSAHVNNIFLHLCHKFCPQGIKFSELEKKIKAYKYEFISKERLLLQGRSIIKDHTIAFV